MHVKTAFVVLAALASASAVGCGSSNSNSDLTGTARASLHRSKNCSDLLGDLKGDAIYKLDKAINQQIAGINACVTKYGDAECAFYGGYVGISNGQPLSDSSQSGAVDPTSAPSGGTANGSTPTTTKSADDYSQTNTQVQGVDEADIVKNDGKNLYILHGNAFKVINAWPADQLKEVGSIDIEGTPNEMFVSDGKVVVYSQVNGAQIFQAAGVTPKQQFVEYGYATSGGSVQSGGTDIATPRDPSGINTGPSSSPAPYVPLTKITVMQLNGTTPSVTREVYFEGSYLDARRVDSNVRTVLQGYQYGPQLKYSVYDIYPAQAPSTVAAPPPGGGLQGNEGTGDYPTTTTPPSTNPNPYPQSGSQMIAALHQLRAANVAIINNTQITDWLPNTFVKDGAAISTHDVACEDFYVPTVGSTQSGLTEVASLDLSDPTAVPQQTAILGQADTVYANADTMYLAAHAWVEPPFQWSDPYLNDTSGGGVAVSNGTTEGSTPPSTTGNAGIGVTPTPPPTPTPTPSKLPSAGNVKPMTQSVTVTKGSSIVAWSSSNTHIHKFEFKSDPKFPNYVASGTIIGSLKDQFSMDDKDGFLRVATSENRQYVTTDGSYIQPDFNTPANAGTVPVHPNQLSHLFVLGQDGPWLDVTGDVGDIAPGEQIQSVRFIDGRGYLVTFRQVDPLFVYDLQNPKTPTLLGALTIPGFSEYMHPLDANHLLTIGRSGTTAGQPQGLQLQVFDVTNGGAPISQFQFTYTGSEYGQSDAEYDHKAFTYFDDKQMLAFPYFAYDTTGAGGMRSSLEIFKVDLTSGFTKLGTIDHTALLSNAQQGYCGGYYAPSVRRGVFLENVVYSISYGGIIAKDAGNLLGAGNEVALPAPIDNAGYGPSCATAGGSAPDAPIGL